MFGTEVGLPKTMIRAQDGAGSLMKASLFPTKACPFVVLLPLVLATFAQVPLSSQGTSQIVEHTGDVRPTWSNSYPSLASATPERWQRATPAFSYDGRCLALAGNGEALVISNTGRTLWEWNYSRINRFIVAGSIAVSPNCGAIAMGGDSSYKYVWIVDRQQHAVAIPMISTPLALTFDRKGESVAIGTGGHRIFLFNRIGKELWSTPPYSLFLPSDLSFTPEDSLLMIRSSGAALIRINASILQKYGGEGMSVSSDLRTVGTWSHPPHGPGPGSVTVQNETGKVIWNNFSDDPGIVVTPAGDKIIARVSIDQELPKEEFQKEQFHEPQDSVLRLFTRDGTLLTEFPDINGRPVAISPDGETVLLEIAHSLDAIDLDGNHLYSIPGGQNSYVIAPNLSAVVVFSRGYDGDLQYFKLR
jgi:hypothetical protein